MAYLAIEAIGLLSLFWLALSGGLRGEREAEPRVGRRDRAERVRDEEAIEYQVKVSVKSRQERTARTSKKGLIKYDVSVYGLQQEGLEISDALFYVVKNLCDHNIAPTKIADLIHWRPNRVFFVVEGVHHSGEFVNSAGETFDQSRWYCDDEELIVFKGKTYAFSSKWGIRWKQAVNIMKKEFPEAKIEYRASQPTPSGIV